MTVVRVLHRIVAILTCALMFGGCAGSTEQTSLVAAQQARADAPATRNRLYYIGLALFSEHWSENDVVELADELRQTSSFDVVPLIASNVPAKSPTGFPVADDAAIAALVKTAAEHATANDIVVVHISTHGARGVLARKIDDEEPTVLPAVALARQLVPLEGRRTIVIISACYSGSLIGSLRSPQRVIVTAARADRSSFGCGASNTHTFFGEAELQGFAQRDRSLHQVFDTIRNTVARMEQAKNYRPSEPQVWIGSAAKDLYEAPLF